MENKFTHVELMDEAKKILQPYTENIEFKIVLIPTSNMSPENYHMVIGNNTIGFIWLCVINNKVTGCIMVNDEGCDVRLDDTIISEIRTKLSIFKGAVIKLLDDVLSSLNNIIEYQKHGKLLLKDGE